MFRFEAPCIIVLVVVLLYASGWCSLERASSLGLGSRVRTTNVRSKWWPWQWVDWFAGVPNNKVLAACSYKRISMSTSSGRWHHDCAKTASNHKLERNSRRCLDASCIIYPWTKIATSQNCHIYIYIYIYTYSSIQPYGYHIIWTTSFMEEAGGLWAKPSSTNKMLTKSVLSRSSYYLHIFRHLLVMKVVTATRPPSLETIMISSLVAMHRIIRKKLPQDTISDPPKFESNDGDARCSKLMPILPTRAGARLQSAAIARNIKGLKHASCVAIGGIACSDIEGLHHLSSWIWKIMDMEL